MAKEFKKFLVTKNQFFLTYIFKLFEYISAFLTLFFVTPKITASLPISVYGLYTGVLSFFVFLKYSDFGFLRASEKFACDQYLLNDKDNETKILAFGVFIQFCIIILFSVLMLIFSFKPNLIFNDLSKENYQICSKLFLISSIFVFFTIPNRILSIIANYKILTYKITPWVIFINIINIANVNFIFKTNNNENIVSYYLISSSINYLILTLVFIFHFKSWGYSFKLFFQNFKFNLLIYKKLWPYASSIIVALISHILYFEIDSIYLLKKYPASQYAFYAIAISLSNYFRNINSIIFSPFSVKYNEFFIKNDKLGMQKFYCKNILLVLPITYLPVLIMIFLMPQFISSWLGDKYFSTVLIAKILLIIYLFSSLSETSSLVINSLLKLKSIYLVSIITPLIYWTLVFILTPKFGILSIAYSKMISFIFETIYITYYAIKELKLNYFYFIKKILVPIILTSIFSYSFFYITKKYIFNSSTYNFLNILIIIIINYLASILIYFLINKEFKNFIMNYIYSFKKTYANNIFK